MGYYNGNRLLFKGLSLNSYIAKVQFKIGTEYRIISPENKYIIAPLQSEFGGDFNIMSESANISLFTGKKFTTGKDDYAFVVSPFSTN